VLLLAYRVSKRDDPALQPTIGISSFPPAERPLNNLSPSSRLSALTDIVFLLSFSVALIFIN